MLFNSKKFDLLRYGKNSQLKESTSYTSNTGKPIEEKSFTKDLGVTMSSTGDFKDHISNIIDTARDLSAWILRSFKSRSPLLMLQLWKSIVIPRLDYCSQLWNPNEVGLIQQLEEVQKSFVKRIAGYREKDYQISLKELGLYSLQRRRERYQVIYLWSILEGKVPNIPSKCNDSENFEDLIKTHSSSDSRRGRTIYIRPLKSGRYANLRFNSLPFAGARLFNSLPKYLRNQTECSKDCFKFMLDRFLKTIPDHPLLRSNYYSRQAPTNSLIDMAQLQTTPHAPHAPHARPFGPRWEESAPIGRR